MMRAVPPLLCVALAVGLGGCGYQLVRPQTRSIGGAYSVHPQIEWSARKDGHVELWTIRGPGLEALRFVALKQGDGILEPGFWSDEKFPEFRTHMSPTEIVELCLDTLSRMGATRLGASGLRPAPFGPHRGFRFELELTTGAGLEMSGLAAGAVVEDELYLVLFTAPRVHYFETTAPHVEEILRSVAFD